MHIKISNVEGVQMQDTGNVMVLEIINLVNKFKKRLVNHTATKNLLLITNQKIEIYTYTRKLTQIQHYDSNQITREQNKKEEKSTYKSKTLTKYNNRI